MMYHSVVVVQCVTTFTNLLHHGNMYLQCHVCICPNHMILYNFTYTCTCTLYVYCRHLTAVPHIAGSEENHMLAQDIYNQWNGFSSFDNVQLINYSVLLSYPNASNPNVLQLMQGSEVIYEAHINQEPPWTPGENDSRVAPPFNAYAGSGAASVSPSLLCIG